MLFELLNKLNSYFVVAFYYFALHVSSYAVFKPLIKKVDHDLLQYLPFTIPLAYAILVLYLIFACLNFLPNKNQNLRNYQIYEIISSLFGILHFITVSVILSNIIINFEFNVYEIYSADEIKLVRL